MKYIVAVSYNGHTEYIAEGKNYMVQGAVYVPFTSRTNEAKRYTTYALAVKAANRNGDNMWGTKEIIEVEE